MASTSQDILDSGSGPPAPIIPPSSTHLKKAADSAINVASTTAAIAKEVGEMLSQIPYVNSVAGIVLQIIKIRDEIISNKERCLELIGSVERRSGPVVWGLRKIAESENLERLEDLQQDLESYQLLLDTIYDTLVANSSKGSKGTKWTTRVIRRVDRAVNRQDFQRSYQEFQRRLEEMQGVFVMKNLIRNEIRGESIRAAVVSSASVPQFKTSVIMKPILPVKPHIFIGRIAEREAIIEAITAKQPGRVAILGFGGMGKTSLAASVLHDAHVVERFERRLFVGCEGINTLNALLAEVGNVLRLPQKEKNENLYEDIINALSSLTTLICFDNFETIWEPSEHREVIDEFLTRVASIDSLALLVTMRGTEQPAATTIEWTRHHSLQPIPFEDAKLLFEEISGTWDDFSRRLVEGADGIPLAITLLAHLVTKESETSEEVWKRWQANKTREIHFGSKSTRLTSLEYSIQLSIDSPRMQAVPSATHLLQILAFLPDGLRHSHDARVRLQPYVPDIELTPAVNILLWTSLAHVAESMKGHKFLRLLSPLREYLQYNRPDLTGSTAGGIVSYYVDMIKEGYNYTKEASWSLIRPEIHNIRAALFQGYQASEVSPWLISVSVVFANWCLYINDYDEVVINLALQQEGKIGPNADLGSCYRLRGEFLMIKGILGEAEQNFKQAVDLHRQAQDVLGEANDLQSLGNLYMRRNQLDEAEQSFTRAVYLHSQAQSIPGEANNLYSLGNLCMRRGQLNDAEQNLKRAVDLHRQAQDVLGEANDLQSLGNLYMRRNQLDEAEQNFTRAVYLHRQAQDVLGEANDLQSFGNLYMHRGQLDEAEQNFKRAVDLHRQAQSVLGEAHNLYSLGNLCMHRSQLNDAEQNLKQAVDLHRQAQSVIGEAYDLQKLGDLYMRRNQLDKAQQTFNQAVHLHRQAQDVLGEANDLQKLGVLCMRRDQLDEAEQTFKQALDLHRRVQDVLGEANDLQKLGNIYMRRNQLDKAQLNFYQAMDLHLQAQTSVGEANDLLFLGELCMRRNQLDDAEQSFKRAVDLHRQAQDVLGEANILQNLGDLCMHRDQLDEAEQTFKQALDLHRQAQSVIGEAYDLQKLGELYMRRDQLGEAEHTFTRALDLHRQAQYVTGEATDLRKLGELYMRRDQLDEAGQNFRRAVDLHRQAQSVLGEANDLQKLGDLCICRDQLDEAEQTFTRALDLHRQAQCVFGETEDLQKLDELSMRREQLNTEAKQDFQHA